MCVKDYITLYLSAPNPYPSMSSSQLRAQDRISISLPVLLPFFPWSSLITNQYCLLL